MKKLDIWVHNNIQKKIQKLGKKHKVILYAAQEYEVSGDFDPSNVQCPENISYIYGSAGIEEEFYQCYSTSKSIDFWYNFWLYSALWQIDISHLGIPSNNKLFISLNNVARLHRCMLMDSLYKNGLLSDNIVSWHDPKPKYRFKYWSPKIMQLNDNFIKEKSQYRIPKEYSCALFNLIAEATVDVVFLTEKTWHAILCGKPFLVLGAPGIHKFLRSKGYKLFDNVIDYSFDNETDLGKRIEMLVQEIKKLENKNYKKIYKELEHICKHNKQLAIKHIKNQEGVPESAKEYNYYRIIINEATQKLCLID